MGQEQKVIQVELGELGYLEKNNSQNLDSKTGGSVGSGNYTKYWRDMKPEWQGNPWCMCMQGWSFKKAYGEQMAQILLCGGLYSYYCPANALYFKNKGQWVTSGFKPGDVVFFKYGSEIGHVGLVVDVQNNGKLLVSVEGNTGSGDNTVIPNGGGVFQKKYTIPASYVVGAGRPDYSLLQPKIFGANVTLNRAMAVTTLFALCGKSKVDTFINFEDVPKGCYYYEPVKWAVRNGITVGASDKKFNPFGYCTRAMFLQMMWRISGSPKVSIDLPFDDVKEDKWYYNAVCWAYKYGIVKGVSEKEFAPNKSITRAEAAQMIYAAQGKPTVTGKMPFEDVAPGKWYYNAILFCAQKGIFSGIS